MFSVILSIVLFSQFGYYSNKRLLVLALGPQANTRYTDGRTDGQTERNS